MSDPLQLYCNNSENCRRVAILRAIGSQEDVKVSPCCDVCDGGVHVPPSLLFEANAVLPSSKSTMCQVLVNAPPPKKRGRKTM